MSKGKIVFSLIVCHVCVCIFWAAYLKWPYGNVRSMDNFRFNHPPPFTDYEKKAINGKAGIFDFLIEVIDSAVRFAVNIKFVGISAILFVLILLSPDE